MKLTEREKAYHDGYEQGWFDEYAELMGYDQAEKVKAKIDKQKNCPYCHVGHQPIYEQDNSARLVRINLRGNKKHPYHLNFTYQDKLEKDDYEPGGWRITNPAEHYRTAINFCPICGRDLRGDN